MDCKSAGRLLDLLVGVVGPGRLIAYGLLVKPAYGRTVAFRGLPWNRFVVSRQLQPALRVVLAA